MILIDTYINGFSALTGQQGYEPWELTQRLDTFIREHITTLGAGFIINNGIAIHETAVVEANVILKSPVIIGKDYRGELLPAQWSFPAG